MRCHKILATCLSLLLLATTASATKYLVKPDGTGDFFDIQTAISNAGVVDGDTIELASGTFMGSGNRDIDYSGKAIVIRSQTGDAEDVIINCLGSVSDQARGFIFDSDEGSGSILEYVTIWNAYKGSDRGGAVYIYEAAPTIANNRIAYSYATMGGGIYCYWHDSGGNAAVIRNNIISYCESPDGGGVCVYSADGAIVANNYIYSNQSSGDGGGIAILYSDCLIANNDIDGNSATSRGGGVWISDGSPVFKNNLIRDNSSATGGGMYYTVTGATDEITLVNNTIVVNNASSSGGGLYTLENTFAYSTIFWGNTSPSGSQITLRNFALLADYHCVIEGGLGGIDRCTGCGTNLDNMLTSDPYFVSGPDGDYYLSQIAAGQTTASPCLDNGHDLAANVCIDLPDGTECLDEYPTRNDLVDDAGTVDRGWHPVATGTISTWEMEADGSGDYPNIQACINQARSWDTILLGDGTYQGTGNRDLDYKGLAITILSASGNAAACIIDCQGSSGDHHRGVFFQEAEGPHSVLQGVTITNGYATDGGGIRCADYCGAKIMDCIIENNTATQRGGGIDVVYYNNMYIRNNVIRNNTVTGTNGEGGGMCVRLYSDGLIMGNTFRDNAADWGGGLAILDSSDPSVSGNDFFGNDAEIGGGIAYGASLPAISGCTFGDNYAKDEGGGLAVYTASSYAQVDICTFYNNESLSGSAIHCYNTSLEVNNSILSFGTSAPVTCNSGGVQMICSDVYGNTGGDYVGCIAGQNGTFNNIGVDPRFCDAPSENFSLEYSSLCSSDNNPSCGNIGAWEAECAHTPETYVVDPDGTGDFETIQAALDVSYHGDVIELVDTTYTGTGNRDLDYRGMAVTVRAQSGNPLKCVIDCEGSSGDPHRGFLFDDGEGAGSVLSGVGVTNGYGDLGGAIRCDGASPTFINCYLSNNASSNDGGAVYCVNSAAPSFRDCWMVDNTAGDDGGAIQCRDGGHATLAGCVLARNVGSDDGGAVYLTVSGHVTMDSCTVYDNQSAGEGSAFAISTSSTATLAHTIVAFNGTAAAFYCGGGGTATVSCCDVYGNPGGDYTSCIAGQNGVNGNFSTDPLFCGPVTLDLTVARESDCAADNNPTCGQVGAFGVGCVTAPATWVVDPGGGGNYLTIQAAIDASYDGDIVELVDATFTGTGNRDLDYHGKAITVRSQSGDATACIIDCQGSSGDPHRGFYFHNSEITSSILSKVKIVNAWHDYGGGMRIDGGSSPRIADCIVSNCTSTDGGGIFVSNGSNPSISGCLFEDNSASNAGGGVRLSSATAIISTSVFEDNYGHYGGGGIYFHIGDAVVSDCEFTGNSSNYWGGAVHAAEPGSSPLFLSCTFYANDAPSGGVAYTRVNGVIDFDECILSYSTQGAAAYCSGTGVVNLTCSDVYGNAGGDYVGCLAGQETANGNISEDPLFCDAPLGDLTLKSNSPCLPGNNDCDVTMGCYDQGCVATAVEDDAGDVLPTVFELGQNYPNPFNPTTTIAYDLPEAVAVSLRIYDVTGRLVKTLVDGEMVEAGRHKAVWDGFNNTGNHVASGVYYYRIDTPMFKRTRSMLLLK